MARRDDEGPGPGATGEWEPLLSDLERRRDAAREMGGPEKLAARRRSERLDARQRIDALCDPGSFQEIGTLVGGVARGAGASVPADALVTGMGSVDGRPFLVGSEDFTVMGGSIGLGTHAKRVRLARLAAQERLPLVMLLEGAGERVSNSLERYPYAPNDLQALAELSGLVPTVAVVMGASAGHGALTAPLMDWVVMVEGAALFSAGPPLVEAATGERVDKESLGGARVHTEQSGVAHNRAEDEVEALALVRRYLSYFPSNAWQHPPRSDADDGPRALDDLLDLIPPNPRKPYDVRAVVERVADRGSVLEVQPGWGASVVTALARLCGQPVGIVANQPLVRAGAIDRDAGEKAARFIEIADAFHLPLVFLADNPGVLAGSAAPGRPHVRRPGAGSRSEAPRDPAQGVRIRQLPDGDEPLRRADPHPGVSRRHPGRDARRRRRQRRGSRSGHPGAPGCPRGGRALGLRRHDGLRRGHRPPGAAQCAADGAAPGRGARRRAAAAGAQARHPPLSAPPPGPAGRAPGAEPPRRRDRRAPRRSPCPSRSAARCRVGRR
jgi:acetyl-CoA carboxylase carboxyltransferase component